MCGSAYRKTGTSEFRNLWKDFRQLNVPQSAACGSAEVRQRVDSTPPRRLHSFPWTWRRASLPEAPQWRDDSLPTSSLDPEAALRSQ